MRPMYAKPLRRRCGIISTMFTYQGCSAAVSPLVIKRRNTPIGCLANIINRLRPAGLPECGSLAFQGKHGSSRVRPGKGAEMAERTMNHNAHSIVCKNDLYVIP